MPGSATAGAPVAVACLVVCVLLALAIRATAGHEPFFTSRGGRDGENVPPDVIAPAGGATDR